MLIWSDFLYLEISGKLLSDTEMFRGEVAYKVNWTWKQMGMKLLLPWNFNSLPAL